MRREREGEKSPPFLDPFIIVWTNCMDKHYKIRSIRISDEYWKELKEKRRKSKKSWNLFIKELLTNLK